MNSSPSLTQSCLPSWHRRSSAHSTAWDPLCLQSHVLLSWGRVVREPGARIKIGDLARADESPMFFLSWRDETTFHHTVMAHELEPFVDSVMFAFVASPQFRAFPP